MRFRINARKRFSKGINGRLRALQRFGGVPHHIWYDNLKTAVQKVLRGHHRDEQPTFTVFRSHHLFESRFCNPREGHEKGLVENLVGYARQTQSVSYLCQR
jgi:transposase